MPNLPNSHTCFVCGDQNPAGLRRRFQTDGAKVWTDFEGRPEQAGYNNVVHGGILSALLDETMGWAPALHNKRMCVAVELHVEFRKSVPVGLPVTVIGHTVDGARRIWTAEGEIRDAEGTVYVRGRGRYVPISDEQTEEVMTYLLFDGDCIAPGDICRTWGERGADPE